MDSQSERQRWMATLAKAAPDRLQQCVEELVNSGSGRLPAYRMLRSPETGLVMVRGRAGGTGQVFNLGEMTLTRCVVQIEASPEESPITGFGYVSGRSHPHAELAAVCDALMQMENWRDRVQLTVIAPLQADAQQRQETQQRQTAATRVNFLTLLRGE
ncbi:MAG: phosphonate C-P lyase system protein PhnG [Synechococcales bacterium]|nr:phosphonate C-P lyase system protein PhnG [Synechococcales bacterium]